MSVVIPVFNGRDYVETAVRSVIAQTLQPVELFLVDDGSIDGSQSVLEAIDTPFPKYVLHQKRQYQSAARNMAAAKATGKYLAFLDHDDLWYPKHLEKLIAPMEADDRIGWVYSDMDEIDTEGNLVALNTLRGYSPSVAHPKTNIFEMLGSDMFIFPSAAAVRRSAFLGVGGFDERLSGYEDDDLFLRLFRAGWLNVYLPESLLRYRRHASSSSFSERMWQSRDIYAGKLIDSFPDNPHLVRFFVRDIIAPRFFQSAKAEYLRHLPHRRWIQCSMSVELMCRFLKLRRVPLGFRRASYYLLLRLMAFPRFFALIEPLIRRIPRISRFLTT